MRVVANEERVVKPEGLAGWLLMRFGGRIRAKFPRGREERRMKLAETLSLGGRRQLMLVICDGQRFLVGTNTDGVGTIVAVTDAAARSEVGPVEMKMRERVF